MMDDHRRRFRDAHQDIETAKGIPDTPQTGWPSPTLIFCAVRNSAQSDCSSSF